MIMDITSIPVAMAWGFLASLIPAAVKGIGSLFKKKGAGDVLGSIGSVVGGAAKGASEGRASEQMLKQQLYNDAVNAALGRSRAEIDQEQFKLRAPQERVGSVGRNELLKTVGDISFGGPGNWKVTGGLRPSAISALTKEAGDLATAQHMQRLRSGEALTPLNLPDAPQYQGPGFLEKLGGAVGTGGSILGGILSSLNQKGAERATGGGDSGPTGDSFLKQALAKANIKW